MKQLTTAMTILAALLSAAQAQAQGPPLLPEPVIAALAEETSGETAKRNLEYVSRYHRTRASRQFRAAAEFIAEKARSYGLADAEVLNFPADGKTMFGTQKSRPAWDADFAELWELRRDGDQWVPAVRLASWEAMPMSLAQDSESADVTADLVDVGEGTSEADYAGKNVRGKIVLAAAQPGAVARLAVEQYGAAGIVSYAQNQRTAWWGENENLVRWGHLDSFSPAKTFGFMVSLKRARELRQRLARGETIHLHARVDAWRRPGNYDIVTATIPGADEKLRSEEIVFSCHLDHPRPGANDNASGCVTILEVARTLAKLIAEGRLARPARTIRFIWPPEIEGTVILLNARPDLARRMKAVIHMDMVGGGPETKAIFHVTRGPISLPSFINDVAEAFVGFVNEQSEQFAKTGAAKYPLVAPEGGREPLRAEFANFSMGSDHQVYTDGSWRIPAIYLNDWPDRYIHTNFDSAAMIDPTKLKRAGFVGAASGYFLAAFQAPHEESVVGALESHRLRRLSRSVQRASQLSTEEAVNLLRHAVYFELELLLSIYQFHSLSQASLLRMEQITALGEALGVTGPDRVPVGEGALLFKREEELKGPMSVFGYDYFEDHCRARNVCDARLLRYRGLWGSGSDYAYEALNLVNGTHTAQEIREALSASYGPVPLDLVVEYLRALEAIGVLRQVSPQSGLCYHRRWFRRPAPEESIPMPVATMKALRKTRPERGAVLESISIPQIGPREVLVRVRAASICGTDLHIYDWDPWSASRIHPPMTFGHEFCGVVETVGAEVTTVGEGDFVSAEMHVNCGYCRQCRVGQRHLCQNLRIIGIDLDGCFAEFVRIPERNIWKIDPAIPEHYAAILDPLGNAVHTVLAGAIAAQTVAVTGCGPIGLMAIAVAKGCGCSTLFATEVNPHRLALAKQMGADEVWNPGEVDVVKRIREATGGTGVDVLLEMSGHPAAIRQGLEMLRGGGRASLLGIPTQPVTLDLLNLVIFKGATVQGIYGRKMFETWVQMTELLRAGRLNLEPLFKERMPLDRFDEAFTLLHDGRAGKILFYPNGAPR